MNINLKLTFPNQNKKNVKKENKSSSENVLSISYYFKLSLINFNNLIVKKTTRFIPTESVDFRSSCREASDLSPPLQQAYLQTEPDSPVQ